MLGSDVPKEENLTPPPQLGSPAGRSPVVAPLAVANCHSDLQEGRENWRKRKKGASRNLAESFLPEKRHYFSMFFPSQSFRNWTSQTPCSLLHCVVLTHNPVFQASLKSFARTTPPPLRLRPPLGVFSSNSEPGDASFPGGAARRLRRSPPNFFWGGGGNCQANQGASPQPLSLSLFPNSWTEVGRPSAHPVPNFFHLFPVPQKIQVVSDLRQFV